MSTSPSKPESRRRAVLIVAIVTKRWDEMRWTPRRQRDLFAWTKTPKRTAKSCGPDTRCWCQVCGKCPAVDGDNKLAPPGRARSTP